ncbi:helix-turn-helix transcriptional regulator [Clostridium scatologenes]|uniref:RNA polymerase subunit sigma-70 n=1 Tax=Clostridium scatologenes TaxID=1548 RepID=A0A0E3MC00_CLOSL|nr:helix-turn-helix transcriptional regulator [Clostridium scatologenes]AKA72357.1 hypothetical protein CSCA_5232 [Clostridium scatologenes]
MTDIQKEKIHKMRKEGQSYSKIALALGISENTIKSYCRRNNLGANKAKEQNTEKKINTSCRHCGKPLIQGTKGQPKKFCSEECRRAWWKMNQGKSNRKAFYKLKCVGCGKKFESYGNKKRKFCSHTCYINYRFKKESV